MVTLIIFPYYLYFYLSNVSKPVSPVVGDPDNDKPEAKSEIEDFILTQDEHYVMSTSLIMLMIVIYL